MDNQQILKTVYFGKVPSRGDFVRSPAHPSLTASIDQWLARGLELMLDDRNWKQVYDAAPSMHFAFMGLTSRSALAGHLIPSRDASGRRLPFVTAGAFRMTTGRSTGNDASLRFLGRCPLTLGRAWHGFEEAARQAVRASDASQALDGMTHLPTSLMRDAQAYEAGFADFLVTSTLEDIDDLLRQSGHESALRHAMTALGVLLKPLPASRRASLDKGLDLPLPRDPVYQPLVATLWLELVVRFLGRSDLEVLLLLNRQPTSMPPRLRIGFSGAAPACLRAALDPRASPGVFLQLDRPDWIEAASAEQPELERLWTALEPPGTSLHDACAAFATAFPAA